MPEIRSDTAERQLVASKYGVTLPTPRKIMNTRPSRKGHIRLRRHDLIQELQQVRLVHLCCLVCTDTALRVLNILLDQSSNLHLLPSKILCYVLALQQIKLLSKAYVTRPLRFFTCVDYRYSTKRKHVVQK